MGRGYKNGNFFRIMGRDHNNEKLFAIMGRCPYKLEVFRIKWRGYNNGAFLKKRMRV